MSKSPDWAAYGRKGGLARRSRLTKVERQRIARLGALALKKRKTKKQRQEAARKAVLARWAKHRAKKKPR